MRAIEDVGLRDSAGGSTLGELLRRGVYAELPSRFYGALQISLPLAAQFWTWGWRRTAGWLAVASAFGIWALAQQQIDGHADAAPLAARKPGVVWRVLRRAAAVVGSLAALALLLEGFAQVMAAVFKCPGCSG